jgi:hypothetical protein
MSRFKLLGIAAILATAIASPVLAQQAIQEPGLYAFYHPNADLNLGVRPAAASAMASIGYSRMQARGPATRIVRTPKKYYARFGDSQ